MRGFGLRLTVRFALGPNEGRIGDAVQVVDHRAMGSTVRLTLHDAPAGLDRWAVDELDRLEARWSRFRADSDLSRCNAAAGTGPVVVHPSTVDAVARAVATAAELHPWFDPTVLDALEALGYDRTFSLVAPSSSVAAPATSPAPGVGGIETDRAASTVELPAGVRIDLGGIGKGLAADLVAEGLVERGARGAAVGVGGDVRVCGESPTGGGASEQAGRWPIPVSDPFAADVDGAEVAFVAHLAELDGSAAIVTSTRQLCRWERAGEQLHHLIDPRTGRSAASDVLAAVVVGGSAAWAESVAKSAVIAGRILGAELIERSGCHGWLAGTDGGLHPTF